MFGRSIFSQRLVAFLIPFTFVWSWAVCSLLCTEITERHTQEELSAITQNGESYLDSFDPDSCPMTAGTAVIETRQTFTNPSLAIANNNSSSWGRSSFVSKSVYPVDVHQNSPPRSSSDPPLFLQFCTFRI
jgi:hypothetical protein